MTTPTPEPVSDVEPEPTYTRLELEDQIRIAADQLRMMEEEHYRAYLNRRSARPSEHSNAPTDANLNSLRDFFKSLQDRHSNR